MAQGAELIGIWSSGVWQSIGSPSSLSSLTISGYAVSPNTVGTLNARLGLCLSGIGVSGTGYPYDVSPQLQPAELAIVEGLFLVGWYTQLSSATMGLGGSTIPFQTLREADSVITRASIPNIGKEYREMAKDARLRVDYLIGAYLGNATPSFAGVDYLNPPSVYGTYNTSDQRGLFPGGGAVGP